MQVDGKQLGDFLIDARLLSRTQLADALEQSEDASLYNTLLKNTFVPEDELRRAAAHVLGIPFVMLEHDDIQPDALLLIPEPLARLHSLSAIGVKEGAVEVALLDIDDLEALQFLRDEHHLKILPRLTDRHSIKRALLLYQKILKEKFGALLSHGEGVVDALIRHALLSRAGVAHLDLSTTGMLVRYRIGQGLHEAMQLPKHIGEALSLRLKNLAKLLPTSSTLQEGRFKVENDGERHTIHVSSLATHDGEKVILRFAHDSHGQSGFTLSSLGFHGEGLERAHEALKNRSGLIVISGPEGAGKTTALYTLLDLLSSPHLSIATVEETIERRLPHITQTTVDEKKGISWGSAVRGVLKQDVDVLMISNIEKNEVAALAVAAASRGTLVLAGLTSSTPAAGVIQEIEALGVTPLSLSSTLKLIVGLTTVKKLCPKHQTLHSLARVESSKLETRANFGRVLASLKEEKIIPAEKSWKEIQFATAEGCRECEEGYSGRLGLQEILPVTSTIKEMIRNGEEPEKMDEIARQAGMLTLLEDGLYKAARTETSIEQLLVI